MTNRDALRRLIRGELGQDWGVVGHRNFALARLSGRIIPALLTTWFPFFLRRFLIWLSNLGRWSTMHWENWQPLLMDDGVLMLRVSLPVLELVCR
jgi:hypothetical protein